ncbi:MAG: Clp protease N-terminal domain-containing protein, partial [Maioricimonas sp. JB045]
MAFHPDKLTVKAQEAVQAAQQTAFSNGNPQIVPLHLLKALLDEQEGIPRAILQKIGVNLPQLTEMVDGELSRLPKASGAAAQVGAGQAIMQVFDAAHKRADAMH